MLLGYNTNGLQNHRLEDALQLIADRGFAAVALTLDVQHLDPFHCTPRDIDAVARQCDALGLSVVVETGARFLLDPERKHEPTLMTRDRAARDRRLEFYARAAEIAAALDADVVSFWAGIDRDPGPSSAAWLCDGVRRAVEAIRTHGRVPSFEPEPGMAVATMAEFAQLCDALGADAPRLTLDVGHLYVTETEPPEDSIERFGDRLAQVHLEDMRRGVHEHLVPGEGEVDFPTVLEALRRTGYRGAVCFELSRSSHMAPAAIDICRRVWLGA